MIHNVALVLGGGGSAGNAWLIGIIAGLAEAGLDMTEAADLVIGTSAGATLHREAAARHDTGHSVLSGCTDFVGETMIARQQNRGR